MRAVTTSFPSLDDVRAARERIAPFTTTTPVIRQDGLAYKFEFLQHTGSFKVRGALNAALQLDAQTKARGISAASGGNHGLAIAYAGSVLGIRTAIFMPSTTPAFVTDFAHRLGAQVVLEGTIADALANAQSLSEREGLALLHPFDNDHVIAGQGTIALELLEQFPELKRVIVSIGGGGLLAGIASTLKRIRPEISVIGVETRGADAMDQALRAGHIVTLPAITSIARTLGAPAVSERTFQAAKRFVDKVVVVDDRETVAAMYELQTTLGITVEPAAACTLAALRTGTVPPADETLLVLCGRNVRIEEFTQWKALIE